jgi:hypothetical protein
MFIARARHFVRAETNHGVDHPLATVGCYSSAQLTTREAHNADPSFLESKPRLCAS